MGNIVFVLDVSWALQIPVTIFWDLLYDYTLFFVLSDHASYDSFWLMWVAVMLEICLLCSDTHFIIA